MNNSTTFSYCSDDSTYCVRLRERFLQQQKASNMETTTLPQIKNKASRNASPPEIKHLIVKPYVYPITRIISEELSDAFWRQYRDRLPDLGETVPLMGPPNPDNPLELPFIRHMLSCALMHATK